MRLGIGVALSFSILLVLVAGYFRTQGQKPVVAIVSVNNLTEPVLQDSNPSAGIARDDQPSHEPLLTTDLVSRQMMLDYLALSSAEQDNTQNVENLANQYADKVDSLYTQPPEGQVKLNIVADNPQNYKDYSAAISNFVDEIGNTDSTSQGDDTASMKALASAYSKSVVELSQVSVPSGVITLHKNLVTKLSESAKALAVLNNENTDPMVAMANLSALYQNMSAEKEIIKNILDFVQKHE